MSSPLTEETFTRALHRALHHLYDPVELRLNPLAGWLDLGRGDSPSALREMILKAIAALKPGPRLAEDSTAWRVYQVLCYRFEEQSSQEDVAAQMAISTRQVRRLEHTAIRALASQIAAQYRLALGANLPAESAALDVPEETVPEHEQELDWLRKSYTPENANIYQLVESAVRTGQTLLARGGGEISVQIPPGLPEISGQATTLRQVLINLLLACAGAAPEPRITISGQVNGHTLELRFQTAQPPGALFAGHDASETIRLARQLVDVSGGTLTTYPSREGKAFAAVLTLPAIERIPVLVVDDNEDSLRLFERGLEGTHYQFIGIRDPLRAVETAVDCGARVILLDIMLPEIDGWELLGRLRTHPQLGGLPVIISTILPHEQLALSLGAAAFLRKPVNREALLNLLERISGPTA